MLNQLIMMNLRCKGWHCPTEHEPEGWSRFQHEMSLRGQALGSSEDDRETTTPNDCKAWIKPGPSSLAPSPWISEYPLATSSAVDPKPLRIWIVYSLQYQPQRCVDSAAL
jgi:hypothetical protein